DARAFVDRLAHRDWAGATARFDPKMKEGLPPAKLEANWMRLEDEAGAWASVNTVRVEMKDGFRTALVTGRFARHRKLIRVVFDGEERIAGLWFRPVVEDLEADARALIEALAHGDVARASKDFDAKMHAALPLEQLESAWKTVVAQAGSFVTVERTRVENASGYWMVFASCKFERTSLVAKVSYTARSEVTGLFFLPPEA